MSPTGMTQKFDETPVTRSVVNLDDFSKVTLGKAVLDTWSGISNTTEALAAVGNDSDVFLTIVKEGLRAKARREAGQDLEGFRTFNESGELNGAFTGSMGHPKVVNAQVLTMAKMSIEGDWSKADKAAKKAAREDAVATIKSVPKILESMKRKSAEMFASAEADEPTAQEETE